MSDCRQWPETALIFTLSSGPYFGLNPLNATLLFCKMRRTLAMLWSDMRGEVGGIAGYLGGGWGHSSVCISI